MNGGFFRRISTNVQQSQFKKIYRAKTLSTQRKILTHIPNLGVLCAFARDTVFSSQISNIFG